MKCDHTLHLSDICDYVKDKIAITALNRNNYVSTENMLANKAGIVRASSLPAVAQTQTFLSGDVLVSNIRPYFKKIWFAKFDGGCSNDVLVFRAKEGVSSRFLYYVLANDTFFAYSTATSKGTKMPRGDKTAIMEYEVPRITPEGQEKITAILSALDDKIELNNKISANLEQQAQALYRFYFPYDVTSELPNGWRVGTVGEIACFHDFKRIPLSGSERGKMKEKRYPYYGAASLMDYVDDYIFDGRYLLLGEDGTVVNSVGLPVLQYVWGKFWVNNHAHVLTGELGFSVESLYMLFKQTSVQSIVTGAVQPKISQAGLRSVEVVIPPESLLSSFNIHVDPLFKLIRDNVSENICLAKIRDFLLPKLMSGEIQEA